MKRVSGDCCRSSIYPSTVDNPSTEPERSFTIAAMAMTSSQLESMLTKSKQHGQPARLAALQELQRRARDDGYYTAIDVMEKAEANRSGVSREKSKR